MVSLVTANIEAQCLKIRFLVYRNTLKGVASGASSPPLTFDVDNMKFRDLAKL